MEGKKEIGSEEHTLYAETINEKKEVVNKEEFLYKIYPKHKRYRLYIGRFFEKKRGLHAVFNELREAKEHDYLEFFISSGGGLVLEGQQFYNIIQEKFYGRVVTYLDNYGYSMGALLFCMGDKRVIYPHSDIMFHNYSGGAIGKGGEIKARIEHADKELKRFFKEIIVDKGFLSKDEFNQMLLGKDFWFNAKQMCKRKIATHVIYRGKELEAKEYLKILKNKKKQVTA
jgi:ATP-dependent protease ClpP protease subunit